MKPRICFVGLENLPVLARDYGRHGVGGAQLQQTLLAKALNRKGFNVTMVVNDYGQADGASWDGIATYKAFRPGAGLPGLRFLHPRFTGVWAAMKRADADIYYVSCAGMLIAQAVMFAAVHRRRVIFRVASDSDCDPNTLLVRLARDRALYGWGLRRADAVLAQTLHQQTLLQRNYQRPSLIAKSLADLGGSDRGFEQRDIDVLWVSNIQQLKRPDLMLDLAAKMPALSVHMIGGPMSGHHSLYTEIQRRAAGLSNLTFHGAVPYHEVRDYYARARVLVNTSDIEGFPNTYLQAWANRMPVVAFHDPNGLIAAQELGHAASGADDMSTAIGRYAREPALWSDTSRRCRQFLESNYGDERTLPEYLDVIDSLSKAS